jgi:ribosomal protein S12 methylthiotransferase accessory factor
VTAVPGRLDAVAHLFDVVDLPLPQAPVAIAMAIPGGRLRARRGFPPAALPQSGRIASGAGFSREKARRSALGEAVELASSCAWGDEPATIASETELGEAALPARALLGITQRQYDERDTWNAGFGGFDWRPPPPDPARRCRWLPVENLATGEKRLVPEAVVRIGAPGDLVADSNGCACGDTLEQATLAALLELIERDATGRWWYGTRPAPTLDWRTLPLPEALRALLAQRTRLTRFANISSDIAVPVVAAVSWEPDGQDVALGFAARRTREEAAAAALGELLQQEFSLEQARRHAGAAPVWTRWRHTVTAATPPLSRIAEVEDGLIEPPPAADTIAQLDACLAACAARVVDLWRIDLTRREFGVPVVRVLSTTLCHCKPRFARLRLLAGAVANEPNPAVLAI